MNKIVLFYDENFKKLDFGSGHPMRGDRYKKALLEFEKLGLLEKLKIEKPRIVSKDIINLYHAKEYIDKVEQASKQGYGDIGDEVPSYKGIYNAALLSVSATISAAVSLIKDDVDVAVNICGGWHHAFEDKGRGFCIFNDIAIVANYLLTKKNINKIMIIDYDAHHGDGTQRAFYGNPKVYTISFHQDPATLYPFRTGYEDEIGEGKGKDFNRNFPLSTNCPDSEFIAQFNKLPKIIREFKPEILILQMGVDGSKECLISNMQLTKESYSYASKTIMELQEELKFKVLALGGGGFVHPMLGRHWDVQIKNFMRT